MHLVVDTDPARAPSAVAGCFQNTAPDVLRPVVFTNQSYLFCTAHGAFVLRRVLFSHHISIYIR